jgi:hypothetical protein
MEIARLTIIGSGLSAQKIYLLISARETLTRNGLKIFLRTRKNIVDVMYCGLPNPARKRKNMLSA